MDSFSISMEVILINMEYKLFSLWYIQRFRLSLGTHIYGITSSLNLEIILKKEKRVHLTMNTKFGTS